MKKYLFAMALFAAAFGLTSCSSDDDEVVIDPANVGVNVLVFQSEYGKFSTGTMSYKDNKHYNPPYCEIAADYYPSSGTFTYYTEFIADIKNSEGFYKLSINKESDQRMSFSDLKEGDTYDASELLIAVYNRYPAKPGEDVPAVMRGTRASSGKITVAGTKDMDGKEYIILRLTDLQFDVRDYSCAYTVNGTVEYEIIGDFQDNNVLQ